MAIKIHDTSAAGGDPIGIAIKTEPSTQYYEGELVSVTVGEANKCAADAKPTHLVETMKTPANKVVQDTYMKSTTACEPLLAKRIDGGKVKLRSAITPLKDGTAALANSTTNLVLFTDAASADDFLLNGQVYIPELDEQRLIIDHSKSGNDHTLTVEPAFSRAVTVGDTIKAVPFSSGFTAVKGKLTNSSFLGVGTAANEDSGGYLNIVEVDLSSDNPERGPMVVFTVL